MKDFELDYGNNKHVEELHKEIKKYMESFDKKLSLEREFAQSTTLHGVNQILNTERSTCLRLLWFTVFLISLAVCLWQINLRFAAYLEYTAISKITTKYETKLEFPAVTICNFNIYQSRKVKEYLEEHNATMNFEADVESTDYSYQTHMHTFDDIPRDYDIDMYDFTLKTGFQLNNTTLRECSYRGQKCGPTNFSHIFTRYGNCYTFNKDDRKLYSIQPGEGGSFHFVIDIQQDEYSDKFEIPEAGLKILVHSQITPPMIENLGSAAPPGFHTFIGIKQFQYKNLEEPWGLCDKTKTLEYHDVYTLSGCFKECKLKHFVEQCKCKPLGFPWGSAEYCSAYNVTNCVLDAVRRFSTADFSSCDCPVPCNYSDFEVSVSYAGYPNLAVANQRIAEYGVNNTYMRNNFVSVDIYYEELNYELVEEMEALSFSSLISDIGGQAGLFLGGSVITLAEIIQYLSRRTKKSCCKQMRPQQDNKQSSQTA